MPRCEEDGHCRHPHRKSLHRSRGRFDGRILRHQYAPSRHRRTLHADARTVAIQPWDQSAVQAIEKAIINSNIGISPVSDGKIVRLPIPPLSEDRRAALAKQVKARSEEARVAVRNARRDANEAAKKAQKASEITEDELKKSP